MELLLGLVQIALLFVAVAIAMWWALRRMVSQQLVDELKFMEFDLALREMPPSAVGVLSAALADGTESIDDVRFGGRSPCRASGGGRRVKLVVGTSIEIRSENGDLLAAAKTQGHFCDFEGATVLVTITTNRSTLAAGPLPLSECSVVLQRAESSLRFERGNLYGRLSIDHHDAALGFVRGSFELMLRSAQNGGSVLFVTQGRFGLRA